MKKLIDTGGGLGGPIKRDKLWFFYAYRFSSVGQYQQGNYYNKLQGIDISKDPLFDVFAYEPDLSRPAATDDYYTRSQSAADVAGRAQAQDRRVGDRQQQLQLPDVPAGAAERRAGGA